MIKKLAAVLVLGFACGTSLIAQTFEQSIEANGGPGLSKEINYNFGINYIAGARFGKLFVGAGTGFRYADALQYTSFKKGLIIDDYESFDVNDVIPIFARVKTNLSESNISPSLLVDAGYALGLRGSKNLNGFFVEPQFGVDIKLKDAHKLNVGLGVSFTQHKYDWYYMSSMQSDSGEESSLAGAFNIHVGFSF